MTYSGKEIENEINLKVSEAKEKNKKYIKYYVCDKCNMSTYRDFLEAYEYDNGYYDFVSKITIAGNNIRFYVHILFCEGTDYDMFLKYRDELKNPNQYRKEITYFNFITEGNFIHFCKYLNRQTNLNWQIDDYDNDFFDNRGIPDYIIGPGYIRQFMPSCRCNIL